MVGNLTGNGTVESIPIDVGGPGSIPVPAPVPGDGKPLQTVTVNNRTGQGPLKQFRGPCRQTVADTPCGSTRVFTTDTTKAIIRGAGSGFRLLKVFKFMQVKRRVEQVREFGEVRMAKTFGFESTADEVLEGAEKGDSFTSRYSKKRCLVLPRLRHKPGD